MTLMTGPGSQYRRVKGQLGVYTGCGRSSGELFFFIDSYYEVELFYSDHGFPEIEAQC